jgi:PAS domain S-box-containing protein
MMQTALDWSGLSFSSTKPLNRKFCQFMQPTGIERHFDRDELIVTKTDVKGRITYANSVFCRVAGVSEREAMGAPHSIIRHPDMPRAVFKLLWDTIENGQEIFAYVLNMASSGDHYWVLAHVTPTFDASGRITGYHSNRRVPERRCIAAVTPVYKLLKDIEDSHEDRNAGMLAAVEKLVGILREKRISYDEFVFSL